ncbi:MAG: RNA polymerase sigma-54 factor, partial [Acidobacteriota bacterium]
MNRRPSLRQSLDVRLSQRLALTPSLLQKIELLQLNKLELQEMLNQELVENPILEEVTEPEVPSELSSDDRIADAALTAETNKDAEGEKDSFDEIDFRYFFDEYLDTGYKNREFEDSEKPSFETFLSQTPSLEDHLNWQLGLSATRPEIAEIARLVIGNINEDGYLSTSIEEICSLGACPLDDAIEALKVVQFMDPIGVGARDVRECLMLQLQNLELEQSLAYKIVEEHLQLLEIHKFKEIASRTESTFDEVLQAVECIKHLSPKPGLKYSNKKPNYVQPEVTIAKVDDE